MVAASVREELTALLQRLPDRPMTTTRLVTELTEFAELAKESQLKEIYGASWILVSQGRDQEEEMDRSLVDQSREKGTIELWRGGRGWVGRGRGK